MLDPQCIASGGLWYVGSMTGDTNLLFKIYIWLNTPILSTPFHDFEKNAYSSPISIKIKKKKITYNQQVSPCFFSVNPHSTLAIIFFPTTDYLPVLECHINGIIECYINGIVLYIPFPVRLRWDSFISHSFLLLNSPLHDYTTFLFLHWYLYCFQFWETVRLSFSQNGCSTSHFY